MNAIIVSALWGIVMMFSGIVSEKKSTIRITAIIGLALLLVVNWLDMTGHHLFAIDSHKMLFFDTFGLLANCIAFGSTLLYFLLSGRDIEKVGVNTAEFFALIFFVLCGVCLVTSFNTLLMLFLGIEIISIPLYILTGADKRNLKSNEASLKYFLMGAFSTGLMLLGIAFLYGASQNGTFFIDDLGVGKAAVSPLFISGVLLLLVSMGFKVSAAPFHFWTPDVYDGAPPVFPSFMATIGIFAILIKMKDYTFEGFNGLAKHHPVLAATCTIFLLSLSGIPLTAGFFAKYYMLSSVVATGKFLWLVIFAVLCAAVSVYYYFRVIQAMYFKEGDAQTLDQGPEFRGLLVLVAAFILLLGVFPEGLIGHLYV